MVKRFCLNNSSVVPGFTENCPGAVFCPNLRVIPLPPPPHLWQTYGTYDRLIYTYSIYLNRVLICVQVTYITFFNSRVVGSAATKLANKFIKTGYIQVPFPTFYE